MNTGQKVRVLQTASSLPSGDKPWDELEARDPAVAKAWRICRLIEAATDELGLPDECEDT